jgi:histidinol-phosphate aminotransferase
MPKSATQAVNNTVALPTPKPGILDIKAYVAGKSKTATGVTPIKLSSNENPLGASPKSLAAYVLHAAKLGRYPDSGHVELREAIASVYGLDASRIVCGAGSDELIGLLIHSYAGLGDEVLYSQHGFLMYKIYAQGFGATPVTAPEVNLTTSVDNILKAVTAKTKIVFIANPNNPTGSYISSEEMKRLRDALPSHVILAIDGAYAEYVDMPDYTAGSELVEATPNTVMLRTFSKIHGLSSLRLGWAYCPAAISDILNRVRGPFNVSGASLAAGAEAVKDTDYTETVKLYNQNALNYTVKRLTDMGLHTYPSVANFVLVDFAKAKKSSQATNQFLMEKGIIVRDVESYGLPTCLRISIGKDEENVAVCDAIEQFLKA